MARPGIGLLLAAPLLAWLAGVAAQLHESEALSFTAYAALAAAALGVAAVALVVAMANARGGRGDILAPTSGARVARSYPAERPRGRRAFRPLGIATFVVACAVLGFASAGLRAAFRLDETLPAALEGRDIVVTGVIASLPQRGSQGTRFRFDLESHDALPVTLPPLLALGWYAGFHEDAALASPRRELRAGQRWRFTVRLRRPHGNLNPHGFDYELLLFEQGVRATGYVRDAPAVLLDASAGHPVERLRQAVRDGIDAHVADRRAAGVLAALAIGDQSAIEREDWELFRNTGVAHLMSISGLHVTMFAWLAGLVVAAAWRRSARATLAMPAPLGARWGGLVAATAYAVFSGWGVPSQRTVWMLAVVTVLQSAGVRWPWPLMLLAAAAVVSTVDPWALLQPGFWLSFTAVGLLMASSYATPETDAARRGAVPADGVSNKGWRNGAGGGAHPGIAPNPARSDGGPAYDGPQGTSANDRRAWPARALGAARSGLRTQVIATLGLAPLSLVFFQQVSLVGFLANVVAIPLVTLVVTPLALLGAIAWPLWLLGAAAVQGLSAFLALLGAAPGAVWVVAAAPPWAQLAGLVAAVLVVAPLPWRARALAVPLAIALFVPPRELPAEGSFDLLAADVGQGMAVLVRTRSHALLYDAGPQYSRDSDAGQRVLVPLLRALGQHRLDVLMLSHRDLDHVGGARAVLAGIGADEVSSSLAERHPLLAGLATTADSADAAPPASRPVARATRCLAGQRWTWDGVDFAVLHPGVADYAREPAKANALSCVLRISGGGRSALLAGDIEREQEAALVVANAALRSDVLVVPHHGSRTSSTIAFVEAVAPKVAVVQAGYRNRFGHPAADVVERYRERGAAVVATAQCGAWHWRADAPGGVCQRDAARRYWQHPGD